MSKARLLCCVAAILCSLGIVHASPISYTISATASGSLGATNFSNQLVTLTMHSDTSVVTQQPVGGIGQFNYNAVGTASVTVSGIGSATLTDTFDVYDVQWRNAAGFSVQGGSSVLAIFDPAFSTYDLQSPFGPITNTNFFATVAFPTTAGDLVLTNAGNTTFSAGADTPEPITFSLLGVGLAVLAGARRLRPRSL